MEEYEKVTLLRSNLRSDGEPDPERPWKRPTIFYGKVLYSGRSDHSSRPERWTEVKVYQDKKGGYRAGIAHKTNWGGERDKYLAFQAIGLGDIIKTVRGNAPDFEKEVKQTLGVQPAQ